MRAPRSLIPIVLAAAFLAVASLPTLSAAQGTRFLRQPSVSAAQIAFVHANDIWTVARSGGVARRITTGVGAETNPEFSPDGQWIAFSAQYDGNQDVYVIPAAGGQPTRLTWHPGGDEAQGWTPDGRVLFRSGREGVPTMLWKFYTVSREGGFPEPIAAPQAYAGAMNDDGSLLAYQEIGYWDPEWRNHRGGQAQPVSVVSTSTWERRTPPWEGERQMEPVWLDGRVFYMSERDWASNVWSWDPATGAETQHTFHADFDVKTIGAGDGAIVYEQAGYLHELDPATNQTRQLVIEAPGDQNWVRPRWEDISPNQIRDVRLSPTGMRAVFEHRGEIFTAPAGEGSWRNLTRSPGVADRHPVWSPDGGRIAWFSDSGGEYGLVVSDQDGSNTRRIEIDDPSFFFLPEWSPDGTSLAFTDTHYRILVVDVETGALTHVDTDRFAHPERSMNPVWSPDSRWVAYSRRLDNQLRAVFVHDVGSGETHQLTDGMADAIDPTWDASGKYLYFLASTDYGLNTGWLDMTSFDHPVTRGAYLALLDADEPSPFLPESDEEGVEGEGMAGGAGADERAAGDAAAAAGGDQAAGGADGDEVTVTIDVEGIMDRIIALPGTGERDYTALTPGAEGQVFIHENVPGQGGTTVQRYDLDDAESMEFMTGVATVQPSHDRRRLLVQSGGNWRVVSATGGAPGSGGDALALNGLRVRVDPLAEYAQMLRDGWRFMRDFLYVDNVHGAPWEDVWDWYSEWLPDLEHRSDFTQLLDMLSGEVAVGHSYVSGGDFPDGTPSPRTGLLGADLEEVNGAYRIARIYDGEDWNPNLVGPLAHPGMDVSEGDYLVAIEGIPVAAPTNPYELLESTSGRTIRISVNDQPGTAGAREILVQPIGNEGQLRQWAWVAERKAMVEELSDGRLAYVWLPNTGQGGYTYFNRMYFAQQDRQGAVIDERNNGGGSAADYIVDLMARPLTGYFNSRSGDRRPFTQPMAQLFGPKVMVINERAGSGGDLMPYLFRFKGVGPLVGTRTWGGLVGTWDTPPLMDGGRFVAPRGGFFDVNGEWAVEADGVAPDIEVRNDPAPVIAGGDPQLEAAVAEALRLLETQAVELANEPPPPIRWFRPGRSGGGR